jgi:5-(carboxyamino)imidazole ribonucleotide synthase
VNNLVVGVLGGGQLGRMLGLAGLPLGVSFRFLDPSPDATARALGPLQVADFTDDAAIDQFAAGATVVTYEWEGVPAPTARRAARHVRVLPGDRALELSQDRLVEKQALRALGVGTAAFRAVDDEAGLRDALDEIGFPAVLKTRVGGYDGKGQAVLRTPDDVMPAWGAIGGAPLILEAYVPFRRELSIVAVRSAAGELACWPVVENTHADGILRVSRAPAPGAGPETQAAAEACIRPLLDDLDYVGVACVELFETDDGLLANEWAPRVHNSGHWTIEGAVTSQFENHVRAVLGWPLGSVAPVGHSAMVNCIGAMAPLDAVLAIEGAHRHDYGKAPRPGRKVGHVTVNAPDEGTLDARLTELQRVLARASG